MYEWNILQIGDNISHHLTDWQQCEMIALIIKKRNALCALFWFIRDASIPGRMPLSVKKFYKNNINSLREFSRRSNVIDRRCPGNTTRRYLSYSPPPLLTQEGWPGIAFHDLRIPANRRWSSAPIGLDCVRRIEQEQCVCVGDQLFEVECLRIGTFLKSVHVCIECSANGRRGMNIYLVQNV